MLKVSRDLTITMVQGDRGGIEFSLSCITLKDVDKVCMVVTNELNNQMFKLHGIVSSGVAYFNFLPIYTNELEPKSYKYHIKVSNVENGIECTFITNKEFIIYRGYDCE